MPQDTFGIGNFISLLDMGVTLAYPALLVTLIIFAYSTGEKSDYTLKIAIKESLPRLQTVVARRLLIFAMTMALIIGQQACFWLAPVHKAHNDIFGQLFANFNLNPLYALFAISTTIGWIVCQYLLFFDNRNIDKGDQELQKHSSSLMLQFYLANISVAGLILFGSLFLLIPGLILEIIFWVAAAMSIAEKRGPSVIGRCFSLVDRQYWTVIRIAAPLIMLASMTNSLPELLECCNAPSTVLAIARAFGNFILFPITVVTWQCQWYLYKYLIKSSEGEPNAATTKTS